MCGYVRVRVVYRTSLFSRPRESRRAGHCSDYSDKTVFYFRVSTLVEVWWEGSESVHKWMTKPTVNK